MDICQPHASVVPVASLKQVGRDGVVGLPVGFWLQITVLAVVSLASPQEIGTLGYEHVRGKDHFVFEYSHNWLKQHGGILLSGDLLNVPSLQHPRGIDNVFGFVKDSFPDRWGRLLLDRRERLTAQQEGRTKRMLTNYDYLIGISIRWDKS